LDSKMIVKLIMSGKEVVASTKEGRKKHMWETE